MRRLLISVIFILLVQTSAVRADNPSFERQKVKKLEAWGVYCTDGISWAYEWDLVNIQFFAKTPAPVISPLSNDPKVRTANPFSKWTCARDPDGDGQRDAYFDANFRSLKDVGVWHVTLVGKWVDPSCCQSIIPTPFCDILCAGNAGCLNDCGIPFTYIITAFNDPPTASLTHTGVPAWNQTVTFNANASDPDDSPPGVLVYRWSVINRPAGSTTNLTGANTATPTLPFSSDKDIGSWRVQLDLDDNEGERKMFTRDINVPNIPPNINITGASTINVLDTINLQVAPSIDPDGGDFDITWDVVQSPPGASVGPQSNVETGPVLTIPTGEADIGTWKFKATAKDNENASDAAELVVEVKNLPPAISLQGEHEIDIGEVILVETTIVEDEDGGLLDLQWDIIQVPESSSIIPQASYTGGVGVDGAMVHVPTTFLDAGTWIFRLTATDNDGADNSEISEDFVVVVDGPPTAVITGPTSIGSFSFPLELSGEDSTDPDSPCETLASRCHETIDPPVREISPAIDYYTWSLVDLPFELWDKYQLGNIDEIFAKPAHDSTMRLDFGDIEPGEWTFQLEIIDGEGNRDVTTFKVAVVDENGSPTAVVNEPARYLVDITGVLAQNIGVTGAQSFDLDNLLIGPLGPGTGITNFQWNVLNSPAGCTPPPFSSAATQTLFTAGTVLNPACHGFWRVRLSVTDDDNPPKIGTAETTFIIGNCPQQICIDYPTHFNPQFVQFADNTDITIEYHLDSTLYDDPAFLFGLFTVLEVFHEDDPTTPVFRSIEPNVLSTNKGGRLKFNWNGYSSTNERPQAGRYDLRITPFNAGLTGVPNFASTEVAAIWIEVAEPSILSGSDRYQEFNELANGTGQLTINYQINGGALPDELRWRVRDAANSIVFQTTAPPNVTGSINWNGQVAGSTLPTGFYKFELEAFFQGASLGISNQHEFVIYRLGIAPAAGTASSTPPGLYVFVNNDDDNRNNASDLAEVAAGENDLTQLNITVEPAIKGVVTLSTSTPAPQRFKLWSTTAKAAQTALPATFNVPTDTVPPQLFIEGQTAAQSDLKLQLVTLDGETLGPVTLALTVADVQVMMDSNNDHAITAADAAAFHVNIALWDNAYDAAFAVRNGADPANFIERDTRRFYLRVRDPFANANPATADQFKVKVGSLTGTGAVNDNLTDVTVVETGANTGEFVSRSQLLTSNDIQANDDPTADDEFKAHDGSVGIRDDDVAGDRTHRADMDGALRVQYQPGGAPASVTTWDVPVCQRSPEARRRVQIRIHVFNEPFLDVGADGMPGTADPGEGNGVFDFTDTNANGNHDAGEASEPYVDLSNGGVTPLSGSVVGVADGRGPVMTQAQVDAHLTRANIAWGCACIKTQQLGPILIENAPTIMGVDILLDATVDKPSPGGPDDLAAINTAYSAVMTNDVLELFFAASTGTGNAISLPPISNSIFPSVPHGETSFVVQAPNLPLNFRTLAHELGHILTNTTHSAAQQFEFYPFGGPPFPSATFNDSFINIRRRITAATETQARTTRTAGDLTGNGNRLLKLP